MKKRAVGALICWCDKKSFLFNTRSILPVIVSKEETYKLFVVNQDRLLIGVNVVLDHVAVTVTVQQLVTWETEETQTEIM